MMPDNRTFIPAVPSTLIGGRASNLVSPSFDVTDGPVAIGDTSQGITAKEWYAEVRPDGVWIWNDDVPEIQVVTATDVTECSLAFDQAGRYAVAYVRSGISYIMFNSGSIYEILVLNGVTPRAIMDDPRPSESSIGEVLVGYVRDGIGYHRRQRDNFAVEYDMYMRMDDGVILPILYLHKVARQDNFRLAWIAEVAD